MTPSRRKQTARVHPRSEVIAAVAAGVGIVAATVLLIWLLRPKSAGTPGTGGLFTRQPRVVLLTVLALIVLVSAVVWLLRGRRRPRRLNERTTVTVASIVIIAGAILAGIFWPGGVIRHWPAQPKAQTTDTTPVTPTSPPLPTVTAKGSSGSTTPPAGSTGTTPASTKGK